MSDTIDENQEKDKLLLRGLELSDEFARIEGRRPRILIGQISEIPVGLIHEFCNACADMGFDADMAPKSTSLQLLPAQALENDVDVVVICNSKCPSKDELKQFENSVLPFQDEMVMSLMAVELDCLESLKSELKHWCFFNRMTPLDFMAYQLLGYLMKKL